MASPDINISVESAVQQTFKTVHELTDTVKKLAEMLATKISSASGDVTALAKTQQSQSTIENCKKAERQLSGVEQALSAAQQLRPNQSVPPTNNKI